MLIDIISKYRRIVGALILLPIVIALIYFVIQDRDQAQDSSFHDPVQKIAEYWRKGDYQTEALKGCSDIPKTSDFIRCHPEPLLCQLKYSGIEFENFELRNNGDLYLNFKDKRILLKNKCHRVGLAESIYSGGPRDYAEQIWDNFGQDIEIDRFYVNNYQVVRWKNQFLKLSYQESIVPATGLSLEERNEYCLAQGGHLLPSHVMDAASFFPQTGTIGLVKKSLYPWSKASQLETNCESFSHSKCPKVNSMDRVGVSWSGVFHVLGSYPEVFDNPFAPEANLKVSSRHLAAENPWHQLGLRANWKGNDEFDFQEQYLEKVDESVEVKGVAFRCAYY